MKVGDVMSKEVVTTDPKATVWEASEKMKAYNIGTLVVVEGDFPVGVLTERDITYRLVARNRHSSTLVEDVMSTSLITVDVDTPLDRALSTMNKNNFRRIPVLEEGKLAGILSIRDILRQPRLEKGVLDILARAELW